MMYSKGFKIFLSILVCLILAAAIIYGLFGKTIIQKINYANFQNEMNQCRASGPRLDTKHITLLTKIDGPSAEYDTNGRLTIIVSFADFSPQLADLSPDVAEKIRESASSADAVVNVQNSCSRNCVQFFMQAMYDGKAKVYDDAASKHILSIDHVNSSSRLLKN